MAFSMLHLHTSYPHKNWLTTKPVPPRARNPPIRVVCGTSSPRLLRNRRDSSPDLSKTLPYNHLLDLRVAVSPSVVPILSYIAGSETGETPYSLRRGTGVFADPKLIVTSARVIGIVSAGNDSDCHHCCIGRSIFLTTKEQGFATRPVAVNFARDVAVLEVVEADADSDGELPPPCVVADSVAGEETDLMRITRHENCSVLSILRVRRRINGAEAPWPLDGELEWEDYGGGDGAFLNPIGGSPWFNFEREIVGMTSWAAEAADGRTRSFVVPPSGIRSVVDYAKGKGANDPIVMDTWIDAHTFPDFDLDINQVIN